MTHVTSIVAYKRLSSGEFAVTIRCCGDPQTDWVHTMNPTALPADKRVASIDEARAKAAEQHQAMMEAEQQAVELMGEEKEHG